MKVLNSFGFDVSGIGSTLAEPGKIIQLGRPPNRIDLLTGISGINFDEAIHNSQLTEMDSVPVRTLGLESLLKNKAASGRPKDLADLDQLKKQHGQ
jgi:hypothetical protein